MDLTLVIVAVCVLAAIGLIIIYLVFGRKNSPFKSDIGGRLPRGVSGGATLLPKNTLFSACWLERGGWRGLYRPVCSPVVYAAGIKR